MAPARDEGNYATQWQRAATKPAFETVEERMTEMDGLLAERPDQGVGPGMGGDKYDAIVENPFVAVKDSPLSTFSIDVDTASYSKARMYLLEHHTLPPPDSVRIEELINYFDYEYSPPVGEDPFSVHIEVAEAPWCPQHRLARVGLKGKQIEQGRPPSNLVFLLDVSGSMDYPNKLPLVKQGMRMVLSQLGENDRVAIAVYAGAAGLVLPSTRGDRKRTISDALDRLQAGGSTNGGQGIRLAYQVARENFIPGGANRVVLCSDGDFNVGTTSTGELVRQVEENAKSGVYLTVLGFGMGNHNDAMLEQISNKANGTYAFIDTQREAKKVLMDQLTSTLVTIAKDVKVQIEFNPAHVAAYRLVGYENRRLEAQDFNDDRKDAGEIGAGHAVTALYELVPAGEEAFASSPAVDRLKYQTGRQLSVDAGSGELMTLKLRYKRPQEDQSRLMVFPVQNAPVRFRDATRDFRFAAAVAAFGMLLRNSEHRGQASYDSALEIAAAAQGKDEHGYRGEFLELVAAARRLAEPDHSSVGVHRTGNSRFQLPGQTASGLDRFAAPARTWARYGLGGRVSEYVWVLPLVLGAFVVGLCVSATVVGLCVQRIVLRTDDMGGRWVWPLTASQRPACPGKPPVRTEKMVSTWAD